MTGTTNDTTITVRPVINPIKFHSQIYWLPTAGIQLATKNGSATTNLIPNDYNVTIAGVPGSWKISVSDTNVTLNAAEIGNLTVYSASGPLPGVAQITAGNNITISPTDGMGVVTINSTGGGDGTNGFQSQAGNRLITISTNLTDLIYTFSGVSQTNGYPWGILYDAAGTAQAATNGISISSGLAAFRRTNTFDAAGTASAATNGYPWGSLYDAAGSATAATNGWPWGVLYDPTGAAASVTNGFPWGVLYDAAGTAQAATNGLSLASGLAAFRATNTFDSAGAATGATNGLSLASGLAAFRSTNSFDVAGSASAATNGYPWGTLYDAAGSATAATNGWPWGVLYDSSGTAVSVTNGFPWGVLYDAAGTAQAVTNGLSLASGLAAFRSTNSFDAAGSASAATNGYPWGTLYDAAGAANAATNGVSLASGLAAFRGTNTFAPTNAATASALGLVKVDNSTITVSADGTITATTGGGGSVTSVALSVPGEFSVSGSPLTTSGTLAITRAADANFLGFGATNIGFIKITNAAAISGNATISILTVTNGLTNQSLTASTLLQADPNKRVSSIANGAGALTNDASGNFGYAPLLDASALKATQFVATDANTNLVSTQNGFSWTNMDTHFTNYGATTNITLPADGNSWRVLATNGPHLFFTFGGNNMGDISVWITTNGDSQWPAQVQMLGYSNHLTTNCIIDFQPFGGTNKVLGGESEL